MKSSAYRVVRRGTAKFTLEVRNEYGSWRVIEEFRHVREADAKKVFAYIKELQASSPVWNAETANCTAFIGRIANFMGLKAPFHLMKPEEYVNQLRDLNGGRQTVQLANDN